MARCPFAQWRPLGPVQPPSMHAHDLLIYHTVGGNSLGGTDAQFKAGGYGGTESHFGVGGDGIIYQWVDTDHIADANLDANRRAVSVETADRGGGFPDWTGSNVPAWTAAQLDALVRLGIWVCDTHHIPKVMVPDSGATRRGIAGHRQGIDSSPAGQAGYRKPGTEHWSTSLGKVCPGDRRFAQLRTAVVPGIVEGDIMPTADEVAAAVFATRLTNAVDGVSTARFDTFVTQTHKLATSGAQASAAALAILSGTNPAGLDAFATALAAKFPEGSGPSAQQIAAAVRAEFATALGGTS